MSRKGGADTSVNALAVQRLFKAANKAKAAEKTFAAKMVRREKGFTPGGSGSGDVAEATQSGGSLYRSGAHIVAAEESEQLLSSASQFARHLGERDVDERENSCFVLRCKKQLHEKTMRDEEKRRLQNAPMTELDRAVEFRKNLYIARHERGIPARRAVDPYLQKTGAQIDLHNKVPNSACAPDHHHTWMIANAFRQQLAGDVPLMTRIMHGEFFDAPKPRAGPRRDFVELNRHHVRAASAASRLLPEPGAAAHCHRKLASHHKH